MYVCMSVCMDVCMSVRIYDGIVLCRVFVCMHAMFESETKLFGAEALRLSRGFSVDGCLVFRV